MSLRLLNSGWPAIACRLSFILPFLLLAVHLGYYGGWSQDDPYISYRYADNLAAGKGLVFNESERVEGYSNFLYVLVLAGASRLGFVLPNFSPLFGAICALLTMEIVWLGLRNGGQDNPLRYPGLWALALSGPWAVWAVGGLETPFYALIGTVALLACAREMGRRPALPLSAVACALAAMCRPEGVIFFAVCLAAKIIWIRQRQGAWIEEVKPGEGCRIPARLVFGPQYETWARVGLWSAAFVLIFGAYTIWRVGYFGHLLPNTFYSKATNPLFERIAAGIPYAAKSLALAGSSLAALALLFGVWKGLTARHPPIASPQSPIRNPQSAIANSQSSTLNRQSSIVNRQSSSLAPALCLLSAGFCIAQLLFMIWAGGDWMPVGRFMAPAIPAMAWLINEGLTWFWRGSGNWPRSWIWRGGLVLFTAGCLALMLKTERRDGFEMICRYRARALQQPYIVAGEWLRDYARPGDWLATGEAGIVPYYSRLNVIDLSGLMNERIARQPGALHYKIDTRYVLSRRPRFIFIQLQSINPPKAFYPGGPDEALLRNAGFQRRYTLLKVWQRGFPPYGPNPMALFMRRD
ncbi:MAG: hypothetical protein NTX50_23915 [Candidatus Sumerlaeota bacterium]|nr:hypothetical protein [Candidatus Sumerlaeota bacterium]